MADETRVAVVTGGSRGIGAAITRQLVTRGMRVAGTYRSDPTRALGDGVLPVHYELGDAESARAVIDTVTERFGRLDTLVLNAGIWDGGRLDELDPARWWRVVESTVGGAAQLTRAALPALRQGTNASVTLVSSAVGIVGFAGDTAYASAKAAMTGFARSLAKEVGRDGIRVNVLAPGFVSTDLTAGIPAASRDRITGDLILRRLGTADEVARAAVFLAEDATYCTGTVLTADGGWTI